jgi:hypothetical protein
MPKTFRRTGQVYQRHPINGTPDGVISNSLAKETITGEVFSASTGTGEADRDKFYAAGAFTPPADYEGRYVRLYQTPPDGGLAAADRTGFRHEDQIVLIKSVDGAGNFVRLEGCRFEDDSTAATLPIKMDVLASADFSAASANFPAEPHTSTDAGPVVHQVIALPNPANKTLQLVPFVIGKRTSATAVRISDLFGVLGTIPTESTLEWFLKDRPAYSHRDLHMQIVRFILDCGWTLVANRGRWLAAQTTGVQRIFYDDMVFFSDGEDSEKAMYLRYSFHHRNNLNNGTDNGNNWGHSFAMFSKWDPTISPAAGSLDRGDGAGINPLCLQPAVNTARNYHAGWDRHDGTTNQEPLWSPDEGNGGICPFGGVTTHRESWFSKAVQYTTHIPHPLKDPKGGDFQEINYVMFGDKDEIAIWAISEGFGISNVLMGSLEPLPSQIQKNYTTTAPTPAGSNSVVRVGTSDPTAPPSGPGYQVGDNLQLVGQKINVGHDWQNLLHTGEFIETAFIQGIAQVGAVGKLTCVARASLVDNTDTFSIDDGEGNNITFYFDVDGLGGGAGVAIDVSTGPGGDSDIAVFVRDAINGSALNMVATANGADVDLLHNTVNSPATDKSSGTKITEAVNDPGFTIEDMAGSGFGITVDVLNSAYAEGALAGEDPQPMFMAAPQNHTTPYNSNQNSIRLSNRARHGNVTYFDHNGQNDGGNTGLGFAAIMQMVPLEGLSELDPSTRTNRFGLLGFFARDTNGNQWRGRLRYMHLLSKRVRPHRFIRDRDGNYYYTVPSKQLRNQTTTDVTTGTIALGPMPQALAIPS